MDFKKIIIYILSYTLSIPLYAGNDSYPWGKDQELACEYKKAPSSNSQFVAGFDTIIQFHQQVLSEADGPRSHFVPSSSQYMKIAVQKYGFLTGFSYGCDRLIRENSELWIYPVIKTRGGHIMKYDPVP